MGMYGPLRRVALSFRRYQHSDTRTIEGVLRQRTGRKRSLNERRFGRIPTLLVHQPKPKPNQSEDADEDERPSTCCSSRKVLLTTSEAQIRSLVLDTLPSFCSTTFPLRVCAGVGSSHVLDEATVLPIEIHTDEDGNILNLILERADAGSKLKVKVPIVYKGEDVCPGLLKAYYFNPKYHYKNGLGTNGDLLSAVQIVVEKLVKDEKLQSMCMNEVKYYRDALGSFGRITAVNGRGNTLPGGYLQKFRPTVRCLCPVEHIPPMVEIDLTDKDIGDAIFSSDILVHPSIQLLRAMESKPICKIVVAKPI